MYMYANAYICVTTYTALEVDVTDSIIKQPNPILDLMKVVLLADDNPVLPRLHLH